MSLWESILYGIISGLSEFLPISSPGHQAFLCHLFGDRSVEPIRQMLVHMAILAGIFAGCAPYIKKLRREQQYESNGKRKRVADRQTGYDLHLIRTALLPAVACTVLSGLFSKYFSSLGLVALFFALNALGIYLPEHMPHGNKDSGKLNALDGFVLGFCALANMFPGLSRVGLSLSFTTARGAEPGKAFYWVAILGIPTLLLLVLFDFISIFTLGAGAVTLYTVTGYILSALTAFGGAVAALHFMRKLLSNDYFSAFAFYGWGIALLTFILYLSA